MSIKKVNMALSFCAAALIIGCGGGSSSSSSSVSGTVQASLLSGVKVCVAGSNNCATTDLNGKFVINDVTTPLNLEIKIGNSVLGKVRVNNSNVDITPSVLADNNTILAAYIGTFLHVIGGCSVTSQTCNLSNVTSVDINTSSNEDLIEELKSAMEVNSSVIPIRVNGNEVNLTDTNVILYQTANPTMVGITNVNYNGAASVGDYASFSYDKNTNTVTYQVAGNVFGNKSGTREIENLYGNVFFKDKNGNNFYFFSGSLGVAVIPLDNNVSFLTGLQIPEKNLTASDLKLIANKRFNYMEFTSNTVSFAFIEINSTNVNDLNGTWRDFVEGDSGTWEVNGSHLDVKNSNGVKVANVIIRPGVKRSGIVVDLVGGGFGVGVEAKALTFAEMSGTFYYQDSDDSGTCYGKAVVNGTNFSYADEYCYGTTKASGSGTLELNPFVDVNNDGTPDINLTGLAKVSGENEYIFIDPEDGYYISIDMANGDLSIGSNKPLK